MAEKPKLEAGSTASAPASTGLGQPHTIAVVEARLYSIPLAEVCTADHSPLRTDRLRKF
jgi:hypothetical protein